MLIGLLLKRTPLALIRDEAQESLTLDYKRSSALGKWNTERNNLSKDISAFANSEGGMLICGMEENGAAITHHEQPIIGPPPQRRLR